MASASVSGAVTALCETLAEVTLHYVFARRRRRVACDAPRTGRPPSGPAFCLPVPLTSCEHRPGSGQRSLRMSALFLF